MGMVWRVYNIRCKGCDHVVAKIGANNGVSHFTDMWLSAWLMKGFLVEYAEYPKLPTGYITDVMPERDYCLACSCSPAGLT